MTKSISKLRIAERKKVIVKRIDKLEQFILEGNTNSLARKAFEINLKHLREEFKELEILERSLLNEKLKKLTREQKGFLANNGLNPNDFLVERATPYEFVFCNIHTKVLWNFRR